MLAGTGSNVGKSLLTAGLCRIFRQDGYAPAPFKAQNMALNSFVTPDGLEIGRAQAVQAEAAGLDCESDMNPLLLKPSSNHTSQVVLNGKPVGDMNAYDYFRKEGRDELRANVHAAFDRLSAKYNPIVLEGAGSISEINLRDSDLVNMPMAAYADADVILVADIDRGGVFASVYGSVMLQTEEDRKRIKGIIINKFRGDIRLFEDGRRIIEELCGVPVLGVMPQLEDLHIEEEDSVTLEAKSFHAAEGKVNIAVVMLPKISNFTDFDALEQDPRVNLYYTNRPDELAAADIIVIPGSKSTISDMAYITNSGLAAAIIRGRRDGKSIVGICGGFQMMGISISDPDGVESSAPSIPGLGLIPTNTVMLGEKTTTRVEFKFLDNDAVCHGYEIHMGQTDTEKPSPLTFDSEGNGHGYFLDEHCFGSYIHGIFDNPSVVDCLLAPFTKEQTAETFDYDAFRQKQYDRLADEMRKNLDIEALYRIISCDD